MAKIAFLLLAHRDPVALAAKARALTAHGDAVAIHFDARAGRADWRRLRAELAGAKNVTFARRVRCGWGEYSLVQATLNLIRAARSAFSGTTHYFLISGDCYPTKSRGYFDRYLDRDRDVIEAADFYGGWIKTGMREDRLRYRHWFNERRQKWLFYRSLELQRRFGRTREVPADLDMRIGSQWWALRAGTVGRILDFIRQRPDVVRFFRTTWIPDETFFQTLTAHLVPEAQIAGHPPTHLRFSDYGMPVVFHRDHIDYLRVATAPFARKISPSAPAMHDSLLQRFRETNTPLPEGGGTASLIGYLSGRGRRGERYRRRFWQRATDRHPEYELLIVAAKLWHVGEAVGARAARIAGLRSLGYLFDADGDPAIPLGGLERGLGKRNRHRHAMMNLIFDALRSRRLLLCMDTSRADTIDELARSYGAVRILLIDRPIPAEHVRGHALRTGMIAETSGDFEQREVMTALAHEFAAEADRIRQSHGNCVFVNDLSRDHEDNVIDIGHFLRTTRPGAEAVACLAASLPG